MKDEEELDMAVIYLQKIIRGKAIQNMVILICLINFCCRKRKSALFKKRLIYLVDIALTFTLNIHAVLEVLI